MIKIGTFLSLIDEAVQGGEAKNIIEALEPMVKKGLSFVDMDASLLDERYKLNDVYSELKSCGVSVGSMFNWLEFWYKEPKFLAGLKEDTKLRIEQCSKLESPLFMPVPVVRYEHANDAERADARKIVAEYMADITEKAKEYGIATIVENYSDTKTPFSKIEDIEYLLNNINDLYYALDTGNYWFGGTDVLEACDRFMDKTKHVHLKDISGGPKGSFTICGKCADSVAIGDGEIPFKGIFEKLNANSYNMGVTIEICDHRDLINKVLKSIDFIHSLNK